MRTQYAFLIRPDLQPGRKCVDRLLKGMKEDVFCTVPVFLSDGEGHSGRPGGFCRSCRDTKGGREGPFPQGRPSTPQGGDILSGVFPESSANSSGEEILVVGDGCAMYRMQALEEIGWLDERHFDGLEAFDLSLRAAPERMEASGDPRSGCASAFSRRE